MSEYLIGFDIGTSSSKGILVDIHGTVLHHFKKNHDIEISHSGYQEMDMEIWWKEFKMFINEIIEQKIVPTNEILAIGITGLVPGLCAIDKNGEPIQKSILHTDVRATEELSWINSKYGSELTHGTLLPKLIWLKNHEKENFEKIHKVMVPHGYLAYKLTGVHSFDHDTACIVGCVFDYENLEWKNDIIQQLGLKSSIFPKSCSANHVLGSVSPKTAEETGLSVSTKVIVGTGDTFSSMMGGGAYKDGHFMVYLGTSSTMVYAKGNPVNYMSIPHFGGKNADFIGKIQSFGESINHIKSLFQINDWEEMDTFLSQTEPGAEGLFFIPHHKQQNHNSFFGLDSEYIVGMTMKHEVKHIYRALIEGLAYNIKSNIIQSNIDISKINLCGGGALSNETCKIICDILGRDCHFSKKNETAIGIAIIAGFAIGVLDNASILDTEWFNTSSLIYPLSDRKTYYEKSYKQYCFIKEQIANLNSRLYNDYR